MMRQAFNLLVFLIVAAHSSAATDNVEADPVEFDIGDEFPLSVRTVGNLVNGCFITTPRGETIEFKPKNGSIENRYVLSESNALSDCQVSVTIVDENDAGEWSIYFTSSEKKVFGDKIHISIKAHSSAATDNVEADPVEFDIGDEFPLSVRTVGNLVNGCFIITPRGETIEFKPKNGSIENRYVLSESNALSDCQVSVTIVDENDAGEWSIYFTSSEKKFFGDKIHIAIKGVSNAISSTSLEVSEGATIPLSLNTIGLDFDGCFLTTPHNEAIEFMPRNNSVANKYQLLEGNAFSACQVDVQNADETDSGTWTIFVSNGGKKLKEEKYIVTVKSSYQSNDADEEEDDGRQYRITTLNPVTRAVNLNTTTQLNVQVQVQKGSFLQCGIRDSTGSLIKDGENGVTPIDLGSQMACRYDIGPLTESMLGRWTVFLRYSVKNVFHEVQQNFNLHENDKDNDADEEEDDGRQYRITTLNPVTRAVNLNTTTQLNVQIQVKKGSFLQCGIRDSTGSLIRDGENGVTLIDLGSQMACRYDIGPLAESMLGQWTVFLRYSVKNVFHEVQQIFNLHETESVSPENNGHIHRLTRINYIVKSEMIVEISLRKKNHHVSCELRKPHHHGPEDEHNPKIKLIKDENNPFATCRALIGPVDNSLLGDWELCQKNEQNHQPHEECQPASLTWNNGSPDSHWQTHTQPTFDHVVNFNGRLRTGVTDSGTIRTCHVITPNGNDIVINQDSEYPYITRLTPFTQCSISIGPIDATVFGDWVVYGIYSGFQGVSERRLPIHMFLYDPNNPYEQAYNVTNLNPVTRTINLGTSIDLEVTVSAKKAVRNACSIRSHDGIPTQDNLNEVIAIDVGSRIACQYRLDPISESTLGTWEVSLKYQLNSMFTEVRQVFVVKREDPENPILEERPIEYLPSQYINAHLGSTHSFSINQVNSQSIENCHIRTPDDLQYTIMDGFNVSGVEASADSSTCRVTMNVDSTSMLGQWTLIARKSAFKYSPAKEERLNFTIYIEELVKAEPSEVSIYENNDLLLRLAEATDLYETCKLHAPDGSVYQLAERNPNYPKQCGFVVKRISKHLNGKWKIVYGNEITYNAFIDVFVHSASDYEFPSLTWNADDQFSGFIGPDNIKYCKVMDPSGLVIYDNFGRCKVDINKITHRHDGTWVVSAGLEGKMILREHLFSVTVQGIQTGSTPIVKTSVEITPSVIVLSCAVNTTKSMDVCKFQHAAGKVLIPTMGVSEDNYSFFGNGSRPVDGVFENNCGIRISNPKQEDWGIWRCAVSTPVEVIYGFLTAVSSARNTDARTKAEPILKVNKAVQQAIQDEEVIISCNIMAPIHYCYFRNENGSVYNLHPGVQSNDMEYYGAGLSAGECGLRFKSITTKESGRWSCNVGFADHSTEQRQDFDLVVSEQLQIEQFEEKQLIVKTTVSQHNKHNATIEHCRYVRIDAFAFTSQDPPKGYSVTVNNNMCTLYIESPSILDHHPWFVSVMVNGHNEEYSGTSRSTLPDGATPAYRGKSVVWFWSLMLLIMASIALLVISITPKKHRDWTYDKFSTLRRSFRSGAKVVPANLPINCANPGYQTEKVPLP